MKENLKVFQVSRNKYHERVWFKLFKFPTLQDKTTQLWKILQVDQVTSHWVDVRESDCGLEKHENIIQKFN